jgi:hypothetical protein
MLVSCQGVLRQSKAKILVKDKDVSRCCLVFGKLYISGQPNVLYYGATILRAAGFASTASATLAALAIAVAKVHLSQYR